MSTSYKCAMCAHYKKIEGIFGNCEKKNDATFSSEPGCDAFVPKIQEVLDNSAPNFGNRHVIDPTVLAYMGMAFPTSFMPQEQEPEPEPEETEWINPLYRRKRKPRKIISFIEAVEERKNNVKFKK